MSHYSLFRGLPGLRTASVVVVVVVGLVLVDVALVDETVVLGLVVEAVPIVTVGREIELAPV